MAARLHAAGLLPQFLEWYFPPAQRATDYKRWLVASAPYEISYQKGYEPYGLIARAQLPLFDVRYRGYGMVRIPGHGRSSMPHAGRSARLLGGHTSHACVRRTKYSNSRCSKQQAFSFSLTMKLTWSTSPTPPAAASLSTAVGCRCVSMAGQTIHRGTTA